MTCEELVEFLSRYVEKDLPPDQAAEFEKHVGACPPCEAYLDSFQTTLKLGKDACASEEAEPIPERLVQAILAARRKDS